MDRPEALLTLVILSDLTAGAADPAVSLTRRPQAVDKELLEDLIREVSPSLRLDPRGSPAQPGDGDTDGASPPDGLPPVELRFASFHDFRPESLAEALPATRGLLRLRSAVDQAARGGIGQADLRKILSSTKEPGALGDAVQRALSPIHESPRGGAEVAAKKPAPEGGPPSSPRGAGSSLFDLVDFEGSRNQASDLDPAAGRPTEPRSLAGRKLDELIRDIIGPDRPPSALSPAAIRPLLAEIDRALGAALRATIGHSRFRDLESAWLGLRFLVRRLDFRTGVRLHALAVSRGTIAAALEEIIAPFIDEVRAEGRVACVMLDHSFSGSEEDLETLAEIARIAAETRVPVLAAVDPCLLGIDRLDRIAGVPNLKEFFDAPDQSGWELLRSRDESAWIALTVNRFLLRLPYGRDGEPVKGFEFEEVPEDSARGTESLPGLWGRPPWILGALIGESFARTGWGVEITGPAGAAMIEDLPVWPLALRTGEVVQSPLEAILPENRLLEFSEAGIIPLACRRNADRAFVVSASSLHRPPHTPDRDTFLAESRRATLPHQLFVAQILAWTETVVRQIDPKCSAEGIAKTLAAGVQFLGETRTGPSIKVSATMIEGSKVGTARIALRIDPVGEPVRGLPPLTLELPLPGR